MFNSFQPPVHAVMAYVSIYSSTAYFYLIFLIPIGINNNIYTVYIYTRMIRISFTRPTHINIRAGYWPESRDTIYCRVQGSRQFYQYFFKSNLRKMYIKSTALEEEKKVNKYFCIPFMAVPATSDIVLLINVNYEENNYHLL